MDVARLRRIESAFAEVQAAPREGREAALERACAGDEGLRREVERLLAVGGTTHQGPLDRPPTEASGLAGAAPALAPGLMTGSMLGSYEVLGVLGEGGMGVVYRARQSRPSREVALKVIRPGLASSALLRRFEFEAELLGRLHHPGIAQIIEAGTFDSGLGPQPYFAMELVEGRALTDHAHAARLDQRARLELFRRVCDAVEHAHQRGVIHRDLKPGNILVTPAGDPKVLDFGVARAVDAGSGAVNPRITVAATGDRPLIGTLAYMSPEQVEGDPARIDTRTDVYALGVILYQLVSGRLPHDLAAKSLPEALKTVTDSDAPSLSKVLHSARGDLETIAARALEKDRERRYQSAAALAEDVRRFLHDEPIAARPPSPWYQARKFARRNRAVVTGATLAVAALVGGLGATALALRDASRERDSARLALARQQAASALLKQMLAGIDPEVARGRDNFVMRRMLDDWARRIGAELRSQPEDAHELRVLVGSAYAKLSRFEEAETQARAALALAESTWGPESARAGAALHLLGEALASQARHAEAERVLERALRVRGACHGDSSPESAETLAQLSLSLSRQGRDEEAEKLQRRALDIRERTAPAGVERLNAAADLAMTVVNVGRYEESIAMMEPTLAEARRLLGPDSPSLVRFLQDTAIAHYRADQYDKARPLQEEALALARRVLPGDSLRAVDSLDSLCNLAAAQGDRGGFDRYAAEALEMKRRLFGERSMEAAQSLQNMAHEQMSRGETDSALALVDQAVEIGREKGPETLGFRDALYLKGQVLSALKRPREAEPILRELLESERRVSSPESRDPIMTGSSLGTLLLAEAWKDADAGDAQAARGRAEEALTLFRASEAFFTRQNEEREWRRAVAVLNRASAEALSIALTPGGADPDALPTLMSLGESTFERTWQNRAEIAANARARTLQSMARNVARIARAGARLNTGAEWEQAEKRWAERAEGVPSALASDTSTGGAVK